jgi:hypothetical protein
MNKRDSLSGARKMSREKQARLMAQANEDVSEAVRLDEKMRELAKETLETRVKLGQALDKFVRASDAAFSLDTSPRAIIGRVRRGEITGMQIGVHWYVLESKMQELIEVKEYMDR